VSADRLVDWFARPEHTGLTEGADPKVAPIVVVTGFVAATVEGSPTTLKRSGSDYSATIFARLMGAASVTMWKNVDGVYTADPRRVPEAFPIASLKYDEAIELAHFGAQVLHPSAMRPCINVDEALSIPIIVRNIFNPGHPGTTITGRASPLSEVVCDDDSCVVEWRPVELKEGEAPIRGVTSVDNVAMLTVGGTGSSGMGDLGWRSLAALHKAGVDVITVTQGSADASLCVAIEEGLVSRAQAALSYAFEREMEQGLVDILVEREHSVVAVIGEGLAFRPGAAALFTRAMASAGVDIRAIAQGSTQLQISVCVDRKSCTKALRAAHASLALSNTQLSIAVIGATGQVGREFLRQLANSKRVRTRKDILPGKRKVMSDLRLDLKVTALARSDTMRLSYDGIDVSEEDLFADDGQVEKADLEALTKFMQDDFNGNRVIIDCSASQHVADFTERWLRSGIHVVAANKRIGSGSAAQFDECKQLVRGGRAQWYYEPTAPGSGLPVLTSLRDMLQSGDRVYSVSGLFSGPLSYVFAALREGVPFSQAVREAADQGLCEPDPRDDLNGIDVTRQLVVLGRELGLQLEVDDVECESLLPGALADWAPDTSDGAAPLLEQLCDALQPFDDEMASRVAGMREVGLVPVQLSTVDVRTGKATVQAFAGRPETDRVARCQANEIVVEISSRRYDLCPMVLQGPGAGVQITAAGLFSDLLKVSRSTVEWTIPIAGA